MTPHFENDDQAAQHWLLLLRDGDDDQKITAREQLAAVFERRGMLEEATDLLESNVRDGVRNADIFRWLARLYRNGSDEVRAMQAAAEAAKYIRQAVPAPARAAPAQVMPSQPIPQGPSVQPRQPRASLKVLAIGIGAVVLSLCACGTFLSFVATRTTGTTTAQATSTPGPAAAPTGTAVPASAEQPTAVAEPTATIASAPTAKPAAPKPEPSATPARSPEMLLAIIQHGGGIQPSDPRVVPFAQQLDRLEAKCSEDRMKLADLTAGASKVMADRGVTEPILNTVSGVATASEGLPAEQACTDLFAAYATLRLSGAPGAAPKPAAQPAAKPVSPRVAPQGSNCPSTHPIKGNASSMIYHVPGGASYARTDPEACFATAADAQAAGYRAVQR